ncbi:MAG: type II toxin-antitoxin system HigB family toxin [Elusimicrobia bacterium]|nr:type II toxin-antitoxin system HigB family toxin [Elusimicrobiota bacterium]
MLLIGRDLILEFQRKHPDSRAPLSAWTQTVEQNHFKHFVSLKQTFGSAARGSPYTVFNIAGTKYRLMATINYALQSLTVTS